MAKQSMVNRKVGDLVRTSKGAHCRITAIYRKKNTCNIQFLQNKKTEEDVSWWDLKMPTQETFDLAG